MGIARPVRSRARPAREEAAPDPLGRIEAIRIRAGTHSARGCMGPAEFGNAGLSPWKTLSWPSRIRRRLGRALPPLAIPEAPSPSARRRLVYEMAGMPTISLPAPPSIDCRGDGQKGQSRGMVGAFAYAVKEAP